MTKTYATILLLAALLIFVSIAAAGGAFEPVKPKMVPTKEFSFDGCDVYSFIDNEGVNYVARCPNGLVATTDAHGKSIITYPN